jgi:uncharacterized small protein (DUF1192 family)
MARTRKRKSRSKAPGSSASGEHSSPQATTPSEQSAATSNNPEQTTPKDATLITTNTATDSAILPSPSQSRASDMGGTEEGFSAPPKESITEPHGDNDTAASDDESDPWSSDNDEEIGNDIRIDQHSGEAPEDAIDEQMTATGDAIMGRKFKYWITSYQLTANELFRTDPNEYAKLLVEHDRFQDLYRDFNDQYLSQKDKPKRDEGYAKVLQRFRGDESHYQMPSKSDFASYQPVDYWAWMLFRVKYLLRDRADGLLRKPVYAESAVWAISWITLKQLVNFNRPRKKASVINGIRQRTEKAREKIRNIQWSSSIYEKAAVGDGPKGEPKPGKKTTTATKANQKNTTASASGGATKASPAPPKASGSKRAKTAIADKDTDVHQAFSAMRVGDPTENPDPKGYVPINKENEELLLDHFHRAQVHQEAHLRSSNKQAARETKLQDCIDRLEADRSRYSTYKTCASALFSVSSDFFKDFKHVQVEDLRKLALNALGAKSKRSAGAKKQKPKINPNLSAAGQSKDADTTQNLNDAFQVEEVTVHGVLDENASKTTKKGDTHLVLDIKEPSADEKNLARAFRRWCNSADYQPDYIVEAALELGITNLKYRVMPRQNLNMRLYPWQVIYTKYATDNINNPHLRGCLCGDMIGLGKTISMAATMLKVSIHPNMKTVGRGGLKSLSLPPQYN